MQRPVFRFAPSPNGALHLGHALSALLNQDLASRLGGRLLVRIEDIDPARCRPDLIAPMLADLAWLGLRWEEPVRRQSEHLGDYQAALHQLADDGLLYRCYASRSEILAAAIAHGMNKAPDGAPLYPGAAIVLPPEEIGRRQTTGAPFKLRLDMTKALARVETALTILTFDPDGRISQRAAEPARWGDVVLARNDVPTSYHVSVVVDDALQGVTHIVRGRDLEAATDLHRLLQYLLKLPAPAYQHHRLLLADDGAKLAKSRGDTSLATLRDSGITVEQIRRLAGLS